MEAESLSRIVSFGVIYCFSIIFSPFGCLPCSFNHFAVLGKDDVLASVCGEIVAGAEFYDYENKYNGRTREVCPAELGPEKTREMLKDAAIKAVKADIKPFVVKALDVS